MSSVISYPDEQSQVDPVKLLGFPLKIHEMLSRPEYSDIVSWLSHGRAWKVHKPKAFEEKVIPTFFIRCKYTSFVRQANGWGFRRVSIGPDRNSYYHRYFLQGRVDLCRLMKRPGVQEKVPIDPCTEPNFYAMPPIDIDPKVVELEMRESSGNRAVKNAEEVHHQQTEQQRDLDDVQKHPAIDASAIGFDPIKFSYVPTGDIYTLDVQDVDYHVNADPLSHHQTIVKIYDGCTVDCSWRG